MKTLQEFRNPLGETYCIVSYDEKKDIIFDVWSGNFGSQENFRNALVRLVEFGEQLNPKGLLTDVSGMTGSFDSSREWIVKEITPRFLRAGLKHQAVILPKNIFSKLSMTDFSNMASTSSALKINHFDSQENGVKWLEQQK